MDVSSQSYHTGSACHTAKKHCGPVWYREIIMKAVKLPLPEGYCVNGNACVFLVSS